MMRITSILCICFLATFVSGQTPQGISYQAIAFDAVGLPVANSNVGVKISILDNSTTGPLVYSETHTSLNNGQGLFNLNIGQGTIINGISQETDSNPIKQD